MSPIIIQQTLLGIALTLQGLLGITAQIENNPSLRPIIVPQVEQALVQIVETLSSLSLEISADNSGNTAVLPAVEKIATTTRKHLTEELNVLTRKSVVNIICKSNQKNGIRSISGSGVIIDPRGVVLTNAHVAQYLLFDNGTEESNVECALRTGSPAISTYKAKPIFISPAWINDNKEEIRATRGRGTGENDFALLYITGTTDAKSIEYPLPYVEMERVGEELFEDEEILLVAYPAELVGGIIARKSLNQISATTKVNGGFFFNEDHRGDVEAIGVGGTVLSQSGSSGGAAVRVQNSKLLGIIVTTSSGATTGERELYAITSTHIKKGFETETGTNLDKYLKGNLSGYVTEFSQTSAQKLRSLLLQE